MMCDFSSVINLRLSLWCGKPHREPDTHNPFG